MDYVEGIFSGAEGKLELECSVAATRGREICAVCLVAEGLSFDRDVRRAMLVEIAVKADIVAAESGVRWNEV